MKFRSAIIGLGRIGVTLEDDPLRIKPCTHMGALSKIPGIKVVAGCDINKDKRIFFRSRWGINAPYHDYREMLLKEKIDILTVSTWTDSHAEIVRAAALTPSIRAVVCEKPIARDSKEGAAMIHACAQHGKLLVINHERRFEDRYQAAKKIIVDGRIGTVRTIVGHVLTTVPYKQKSFDINRTSLLHDGTHLVDIIGYLAGPVHSVTGFMNQKRKECITAILQLDNGINAFIETGGLRNYFNFELDIQGTDGRIQIGNTHFCLFKSVKSRYYSGFRDLKEVPLPRFPRSNYFIAEYREVIQKIQNPSREVASIGEDGLQALQIIEAIFASIRKGGRRINL